jgi:hypothetical protein
MPDIIARPALVPMTDLVTKPALLLDQQGARPSMPKRLKCQKEEIIFQPQSIRFHVTNDSRDLLAARCIRGNAKLRSCF